MIVNYGQEGNDLLAGNNGSDELTGGEGKDQFLFRNGRKFNQPLMEIDTITDFTPGQDKIILDRTTFTQLDRLTFASVVRVSQAKRSRALITYIQRTGALYYNANGRQPGCGSGGQFANLTDRTTLIRSDLVLIN